MSFYEIVLITLLVAMVAQVIVWIVQREEEEDYEWELTLPKPFGDIYFSLLTQNNIPFKIKSKEEEGLKQTIIYYAPKKYETGLNIIYNEVVEAIEYIQSQIDGLED